MNKFSISHTKWKCQYHFIFIPKYRRKVLYGKVKADLKDIIIKLCKYKNVEIKEGAICKDHVHLCVEMPPTIKISEFMGYIKGRSAIMIFDRYPQYRSKWDQKLLLRTRRNPTNEQYEKEFSDFKKKNIELKNKIEKGKITQAEYMRWLEKQ